MKFGKDYRFSVVGGYFPPTVTIPSPKTKSEETTTTKDLNKKKIFSKYNKRSTLEEEKHYSTIRLELVNSLKRPQSAPTKVTKKEDLSISLPSKSDCWYLSPPHFDAMNTSGNLHALRTVYDIGDQIDHQYYSSLSKNGLSSDVELIDYDARKYYPVTLTETSRIQNDIDSTNAPPTTITFSPPATGIPKFKNEAWKKSCGEPNPERWYSTKSHLSVTESEISNGEPLTGIASNYIASPYSVELARLRLERLRLEEEMVKEVKRQNELERIRGPEPKWYELRTPQFHYEAHKNLALLKSSNSWQDLWEYRMQLDKSSSDAREELKSFTRYDRREYE